MENKNVVSGEADTPLEAIETTINLSEEETMKTLQSAYEQSEEFLSQKDQDLL
jgi:hypothetical protein